MSARAAIRYAKAVLDLAKSQGQEDAVNADMVAIKQTIAESAELKAILQSPVVKSSVKKASLEKIFASANSITTGTFGMLTDNKRLAILPEVAEKYIVQYELSKGSETAVVTTAVALTEAMEAKVLAKVKELTGTAVTLQNNIDPSIIGGFILRVGDLQYDASISSKLAKLKREFSLN